jgi:hypothetical protein
MKLADCRAAYQDYSAQASELSRKLGFSGIALIWVFKSSTDGVPTLPKPLFVPAFWIVLSLALDLMQYLFGAFSWGSYARVQELRGVKAETEFNAPRYVNWGALSAFWLKLLSISIAYWYLLKFASERFR